MYKTLFPCVRITRNSFKNIGFLKKINESYNINRSYFNILKVKEKLLNNMKSIRSISYENEVDGNILDSSIDKDLYFEMTDGGNNISLKELLYSQSKDSIILNLNNCQNEDEVNIINSYQHKSDIL